MRFEDKEIDGLEPLLEKSQRESDLVQEDELEVPQLQIAEVLEQTRESALMAAMREILEGRHIVINDLRLPQKELRALEALKAAVTGRDGELGQFVYAEDRRDLLEQALAVIQPEVMRDLTRPFQDLVARIGNLRTDLKDLEDAQDELLEANVEVGKTGDAPDTADKPKPQDDDMSLDGPERVVEKSPSTLEGPALPEAPVPETTVGSKQDLAEAKIAEPQRLKTKPFWRGDG